MPAFTPGPWSVDEAGSDITRDPRPATERLSAYIRSNNHPLHHASPYVIAEALEACGLALIEQVSA